MKKENLTKDRRFLFCYEDKIYAINVKRLRAVLKKIGFLQSDFKDLSGIIEFLKENKLMNLEFIEFVSFENY